MMNLSADYMGDYKPLAWSQSYDANPGGMTLNEQARLRSQGLCFSEPTGGTKLAGGFGRGWPDARGVFLTEKEDLAIWANEEDHLRFVACQEGSDLQAAFLRAWHCAQKLESQGVNYASSDALGTLTALPENLGCGAVTCVVTLRLCSVTFKPDFKSLCDELGVSATPRAGVWDIVLSPSARRGSEVDLINKMVTACTKLVELEDA
eukprot:TRINITY_DN17119_c0_g1_i1.p1 TRINITY_DN17119_c0_g1~~TRINITY_DN17119_c0_g1_i1.p1  ORF type:complete len:206 (-),score=42.85 TRINITY_DN17119_c0_g1_i1:191-808(-)